MWSPHASEGSIPSPLLTRIVGSIAVKTPAKSALRDELLEQILPTVRAILRRKSGATLADDDARRDNVDAVELYHEVIARVWERISGDHAGDVADLRAYAATVAHNAWSDYLRDKYPRRTRLKNRLRYFIEHRPAYALWQGQAGETLCGLRAWQMGAGVATTERIAALRDGRERIAELRLPGREFEQFGADDWDRLLGVLLRRLAGPLALDDLVGLVAGRLGLKEDRHESIDDDGFDDAIADEAPTPDQVNEIRRTLARVWVAIQRLKPDYRCAYLLNPPGPGKSRAELEVFVVNGIAGITEIGEAVALDDGQFRIACDAIALEDADRASVELLRSPRDQFFLLWKYLPFADLLIGRLLGLGQQQVINRRTLALRELARQLNGEKK